MWLKPSLSIRVLGHLNVSFALILLKVPLFESSSVVGCSANSVAMAVTMIFMFAHVVVRHKSLSAQVAGFPKDQLVHLFAADAASWRSFVDHRYKVVLTQFFEMVQTYDSCTRLTHLGPSF